MQANVPQLTPEQGQALVRLARRTLTDKLIGPVPENGSSRLNEQLGDTALQRCSGTFVTLKKRGSLRGCIGSLVGDTSLVEGVRNNALQAAFHDPRFRRLTREELAQVTIEVSVLTTPQPLAYADADDLAAKLRTGVDGVTLRKGFARATFLPQVWEQLPQVEAFLSHLCMKAGLGADAWRKGDLEVETYQVQHFEEPV